MAGQIVKRGERSYTVHIFMGYDGRGKRLYINKQIRGTRQEAQKYLNAALRDKDLGIFVKPVSMTLNKYLDDWLKSAVRPRVSRRTADGYTGLLERYVREPLGNKKLDKIQPLDIQKVYAEMQARGLGAQVVRHTHSVLRNALKQAVKWGILSRDPADLVELPKVFHQERRVFSPDEASDFVSASDEMPHGLIFEFALLTGMRPEEYLALRWSDIDFGHGTACVQRALVWHKKVISFEEPKTTRSRRTIPLPKLLLKKLASHKSGQAEQRLKAGCEWQAYDLVFCSEKGTPHQIANLTYRYFHPILEKAELPRIRLYDLRHTCATLLLVENQHPKVVGERLGHSTTRLTMDTYSHVLPTMQQDATDRLEKLLYKPRRTQKRQTG
jgi:integrase